MAGFLADKGQRVLRNGYNIIPITPGEKRPSVKNWENTETTEARLNGWVSNGRANHGIGITTRNTPFIDLDIFDIPMLRHITDFITLKIGFAPVRVGFAPKRGLLFKTSKPFPQIYSRTFLDSEGRKAHIEILGEGRQFVAFHIHPETHKPYRWIGGESPETTDASELPEITQDQAQAVVDEFHRLAEEMGWERTKHLSNQLPAPIDHRSGPADPDDIYSDSGEPCGLTDEEIRGKLMAVPNNDRFDAREDWLKIGFAVHHETGGSEFGRECWLDWSEQHPTHDTALFDKAWNSFGKRGREFRGVTFRFVLKIAKEFEQAEKAEQIADLMQRMDFARDLDVLKTIAADCRKLDVDLMDRSRLIAAFLKATKSVANITLGIREAREMVRYRPDIGDMPEWLEGWSYLTHAKQFLNRQTGARIEREAFDAGFGRFVGTETTASKYALDTVKIPVYHMTIYLPGETAEFTDAAGLPWINTYSDRSLPPMPAVIDKTTLRAIETVENHGYNLFSDPRDAEMLHSVLAHTVQTLKRVSWGTIIQGAEAIGKTMYVALAGAAIGHEHVYIVSADTLQSNFTAWAENKQIIFIEELRAHGHNRYEVLDRLKPLITNDQVEIHPKRMNPYNVPNTATYIAATNYRDALPLGLSDTRYFVLMSRFQSKDAVDRFKADNPGYYPRLYQTIREFPGALRKWLMEYRFHADFDPAGRAPESRGKSRMIEEAKPEEQQMIEDLVADKRHPLVSEDILVVHSLRELMLDDIGELPGHLATAVGIRRSLGAMGYTPLIATRIEGKRFFSWSRNPEIIEADPTTVRKIILGRLIGDI